MSRTREEAILAGAIVQPIKHSMKRRAVWHNYSRRGYYFITIHIKEHERGGYNQALLLSSVEGHGTEAHTELTDIGQIVDNRINQINKYPQYTNVQVVQRCIMPTHIHLVLYLAQSLPWYAARGRSYHLGDLVRGLKQGCTSLFKRWLCGEPLQALLLPVDGEEGATTAPLAAGSAQQRTYTTPPGGQSVITLWEEGYNDHVLIDNDHLQHAISYTLRNPYYWRLQIDYPQLFEHRLHISVSGTDYSAYGCIFLLRRMVRKQVFCHRYQMDERGFRVRDATTGNYIPYTNTDAFRRQKSQLLQACEQEGAVLISPAVSPGEQEIVNEALRLGYPVIKLVPAPIPASGHPVNKDRDYCAQGQMLVLGPWEIPDALALTARFGKDSQYAKFHNLNLLAAELCGNLQQMSIDANVLKEMNSSIYIVENTFYQ